MIRISVFSCPYFCSYNQFFLSFCTYYNGLTVHYLAVALPLEGIELRRAGISLPILVLTSGTDFFEEMLQYNLEPSIPNLETLKALVSVLEECFRSVITKTYGTDENYDIIVNPDLIGVGKDVMPAQVPELVEGRASPFLKNF